MAKSKKNEIEEQQPFLDGLWVLMILTLIFNEPQKETKVINIYMGDEK